MKHCATCGALFEPTREWQKYCSVKCRNNSDSKKQTTRDFQRKRRLLINEIKMKKGCARCGYKEHPAALDFNHIRDKHFNISQDPKRSLEAIMQEIEKCEILCSNCHRIVTYEEKHWHTKRSTR